MAKQNCGTCNRYGYTEENGGPSINPSYAKHCNSGCTCKMTFNQNHSLYNPSVNYKCVPNVAQKNKDRHLNASGFLGTGVSGFKVIWWSLGALLLLSVVGKGVRIYKQAKY
jgi:hypothetical protein